MRNTMANQPRNATSHILVTPSWLHDRLGDSSLRIVDVRPAESYAKGHIAAAVNLDLYAMMWHDTSPDGLKTFHAAMQDAFSAIGVTFDQTVVLYQGNSGMVAARGFWLLEYFGHSAPCILDGGLKAWTAAGFDLATETEPPQPTRFTAQPQEERIASYAYIRDHLGDPAVRIFDVRTPEEYYGEKVRAARGGAIPGAIQREWIHALDENGCFKPLGELRALYAELGLTGEGEVIPYCQGGVRSAHAYVVMRLLGYPRIRNYLGSWKEWGDRTELPIETPHR